MDIVNLQFVLNGTMHNCYASTSDKELVYFIRLHGRNLKINLSAFSAFSAEVFSRRGTRVFPLRIRHEISNFLARWRAPKSNLRTEDFSFSQVQRLFERASSFNRADQQFFYDFSADFGSSFEEDWAEFQKRSAYSANFASDFARCYDDCPDDGYIFMVDELGLSEKECFLLFLWIRKAVGDPALADGPAWEILRQNPAIGAIVGGERGYSHPPSWKRGGRLEKMLEAFGITRRQIAASNVPPRFMLIRKSALSALKALNFSAVDLTNGLINAELLKWVVLAMVEQAGALVIEPPKQKSRLLDYVGLEHADCVEYRKLEQPADRDVCLFVGLLNGQGTFNRHAIQYMQALRAEGFLIQALGVATTALHGIKDPGPDICDGFAARENSGYDFALWATALKRNPDLWKANSLLLANDSVFVSKRPLKPVINELKSSSFDVTGLTACKIENYHLQSYFLYFKRSALENQVVQNFWKDVVAWKDKFRIISAYEVAMTAKFQSAGLSCGSLFDSEQNLAGNHINPSINLWREILLAEYPFVKLQLLRDNPTNENLEDWKKILEAYGFDTDAIEQEFAQHAPAAVILHKTASSLSALE
ncbi:hypothetical protein H4S14_000200 [Agrobacterium vitis]|nr:hypothetical protein [Agrobacterium vitis]MBE1436473.1 hypothetical protein [Agrobacterium vitis]